MRKWILAFVAVLGVSLAPVSASSDQPSVGGQYNTWGGPAGLLTLQGALGENFSARDKNGHVVAAGTAAASVFTIPAINAGPDANGVLLTVSVGGRIAFVGDGWWTWQ